MADWTIYVRAYPWLCLGAALAAGFFIVPSRPVVVRPDAEGLIELAKRNKLVVKMEEQPQAKKRGGLMSQLLTMAVGVLLQGGMKVVSNQLGEVMKSASHEGKRQCPKCSLYETELGKVIGWYCRICGWRESRR